MIQLLALHRITENTEFAIHFSSYSRLFLLQEIIFNLIHSPITHAIDDRS